MKKLSGILILNIMVLSLAFGLVVPTTALAATDPTLAAAGSFSIIAQTLITGTGTISGDVGLNSTGAGITGVQNEITVELTPGFVGHRRQFLEPLVGAVESIEVL